MTHLDLCVTVFRPRYQLRPPVSWWAPGLPQLRPGPTFYTRRGAERVARRIVAKKLWLGAIVVRPRGLADVEVVRVFHGE
jgi:plasmid stabilization system protein ParE